MSLREELAEFPFGKLRPLSFGVQFAERQHESHLIRVWLNLKDIARVVELSSFARILNVYPQIDYVRIETRAKDLPGIIESDQVSLVWNDAPTGVQGYAVSPASERPSALAVGSHG